ncbi:MAG: fumarylacetoacetase [Armatimonadetes bacterium]|nr:fumarylacetoacetase [Armatimonadota bacterium]
MDKFVVPASAKSWVEVAADSDFPIQNLPFGLAAPKGQDESVVVAIGGFALNLMALADAGLIDDEEFPILDSFIELDRGALTALRKVVYELLEESNPVLRDNKKLREKSLIPMSKANLQVPIPPMAFVDFYSGIYHASNVGKMFRPDMDSLLPNYRHLPVGYNGRASSVYASGTEIIRPKGQTKSPSADMPEFGPSKELDFELEMGFYLSHGQDPGKRITCKAAEDHFLGLVIVNDWSARDVQRWEYQPLGPFLAKSFATSVSPWIVTLDALEPFRVEGMEQDPPVLPHLRRQGNQHFDVKLEVWLQSEKMKSPQLICTSNMSNLYWSMAQQLAHQTSNGTPVEFGDLYASGTISGEERDGAGSMLERTWKGTEPITLDETGETRTFLEDGDVVTMRAYAEKDGLRIGFGECVGKVIPAVS